MVPRLVTCLSRLAAPREHREFAVAVHLSIAGHTPRRWLLALTAFSDMSNLEADLTKMSERVCGHMNHDHADSLLAWAHFYAKVPDAASATMTDVKPDGFELELTKADGYVMPKVLVPFDPPLEKAGDVRKVAVAMHFAAFNGLGWQYKLANGFYTGAARQAWHHMPPRVKSGIVGAFAVVCAAVMRVLLR